MEVISDRENILSLNEVSFKPIDLTLRGSHCVNVCREAFTAAYGDDQEFLRKFGREGAIYIDRLRSLIERDPASCIHLWLGQKVVGQLELGIYQKDQSGWIYLLFVAEPSRGQGFGRSLEQYACEYFRKKGLPEVYTSVGKAAVQAQSFLKSLGWREEGPRPDRPSDLLMSKAL